MHLLLGSLNRTNEQVYVTHRALCGSIVTESAFSIPFSLCRWVLENARQLPWHASTWNQTFFLLRMSAMSLKLSMHTMELLEFSSSPGSIYLEIMTY